MLFMLDLPAMMNHIAAIGKSVGRSGPQMCAAQNLKIPCGLPTRATLDEVETATA